MIVGSLVLDEDREVASYVQSQLGCIPFKDFSAVGVLHQGKPVGGVVFYNYFEFAVEIAAAFDHPGWCKRGVLRALFSYVFNTLNVTRLDASAARRNKRVRKLLKGLGFKEEGIRAKRFDGRDDLVLYGMTKQDCRWIS